MKYISLVVVLVLLTFSGFGQSSAVLNDDAISTGLAPYVAQVTAGKSLIPDGKYPTDMAYGYNAASSTSPLAVGPIKFVLNNPGVVTSIDDQTSDPFLSGASWAYGEWYAAGNSTSGNSPFYKIDVATGARTVINAGTGIQISGLAFDWTTNIMYAIATSTSLPSTTSLYTIDFLTGIPSYLGICGAYTGVALGCNQLGQLYMVDIQSDNLYLIDNITANATLVGPIGFNAQYAQDMEFDNSDNTMYFAAFNAATSNSELRTVNLATGATTLIGAFPGMEVTGFAIQNIQIIGYPDDLGVIAITHPISATNLGSNEMITITIRNFGSSTQTNYPVQFTVNGGIPCIETCPVTIAPSGIVNYTFTTTIDMSVFGNYTINACTALPGDQNPYNDCYIKVVQHIMPSWTDTIRPQQSPYWTGSTDGSVFTQNSLIHVSSGGLETGWAKFDLSNIPFTTQVSSITLGYYVNYQYANPDININNLAIDPMTASPADVFSGIQNGTHYLTNNTGNSPGWHTLTLPAAALADFANATAQHWFALGFYESTNCPACLQGIMDGWDEAHMPYLVVTYGYTPSPVDVGIVSINNPPNSSCSMALEPVSVTIKNYGTGMQTNIPVSVTITGPNGTQTLNATWMGSLASGASSAAFTVGNADFHLFGDYTIHACTNIPGDGFPTNNCKTKTVSNTCPLTIINVLTPISGTGLGASEPFVISLVNNSYIAVSNIGIQYTVNGGPPVVVPFTGPLAPGTFTTVPLGTLDLHLFGTYNIEVCPIFPGNNNSVCCYEFQVINSLPTLIDTVWPSNAPNWTGSTDGTTFTQNSLIKVVGGNLEGGWAKFDISSIPVGTPLNSVELHFYTVLQSATADIEIKRMLMDPMTNTPQNVMSAIINQPPYAVAGGGGLSGWHHYTLDSLANADLTSQGAYGWFAVGFYSSTASMASIASIEGWNAVNKPYLVVDYTPPIAHDIAALSIDIDTTVYLAPGLFLPMATVRNVGNNTETFDVTMTESGGYVSVKTVNNLAPGVSYQVVFDPCTVPPGPLCLNVYSSLLTDLNFGNDAISLCWSNAFPYSVSGHVSYKNATSSGILDSTMVLLIHVNPPGMVQVDTVDSFGNYKFQNVPPGTYSLKVISEKTWGGGNASDGLAVLKHFLGMSPLTGLNLKAADSNSDGQVNSIDALMILQRFIWIISSFPGGDWVSDEPFVTIPMSVYTTVNLEVLCTGDVNGSFVP